MDQHVLRCFHDAAGGSWWPERMKWDPEGDPGQWDGVELNADGQVVMLHMEIKPVEAVRSLRTLPSGGFIAPELRPLCILTSLRNLTSLRLIKLHLRGGIPEDLAALEQLTILDLSRNKLEGRIPEELAELRELVELNLRRNNLKGKIPPQLGKLGKLAKLDLSYNRLEGTIPKHLSWLSSLEELFLRGNNLKGDIPIELARLGQLEVLSLGENKLTGGIPRALSKLFKLRSLNLRSNNLEGAVPRDLTRLSRLEKLYMRNNRFNGFMPEMSEMTRLKTISFSNNELEWAFCGAASGRSASGPAGLMSLTQLRTLYLNNNNLRGRIPKGLTELKQLERLSLSKNMLEGEIPVELARLDRLLVLDLSHNNLQGTIPADLGALNQLWALDLSNNKLQGIIPAELTKLDKLLKLDVSCNCLEGLWDHTRSTAKGIGNKTIQGGVLPKQLAELIAWLKDLEGASWLVPNPFQEPPEAVLEAGMEDVEIYFEDLFAEGHGAERHGMKAVIVGQEGAGKTSLRRSIQNGEPSPTSGDEESTVHLDIAYVDFHGVGINMYDCAGQVCYYGLLQMFITKRAVCLVICDMKAFGLRECGSEAEQLDLDVQKLKELKVLSWFRFLSWRLPGCDVILVGTKCDLLQEGTVGDTAGRVERACRWWLEDWLGSGMRINVEPGVSLTSCVEGASPSAKFMTFRPDFIWGKTRAIAGDWSCDWPRPVAGAGTATGLLHRITHNSEDDGYRGSKMVLPRGWDCALILLDALRLGRKFVKFERHQVDLFPNSRAQGESDRTLAYPGMTKRELVAMWLRVVDALRGMGRNIPNAGRALEGALLIREYEGSLLQQESFVFLDVSWVAGVLKPVLLHNAKGRGDGAISLGEMGNRPIVLVEESEKASWRKLEVDGILERELAQKLWPGDLWKHVLQMLESIDLAFPHRGTDGREKLVVLMRLEENRPESVGRDLDKHRGQRGATLKVVWNLPRGVPPGAIEKVLTKCCSLGPPKPFWRFGVLLKGSLALGGMDKRFDLLIEYSEDQKKLTMEAYGDDTSVAPWAVLSYAMSVMLRMTAQFPGLPCEAVLRCPEHPERRLMVTSKASRPGDRLLYGQGCHVCCEEDGDKGALAMHLLMMVDVSQPRDEALEEITHRFLRLHPHHSTLGLKGNLQREALKRVVRELEHVMENVDHLPATALGNVAGDLSTSEDIRRPLSETRVMPQLEGIQQELSNLGRVIQQQGSRGDQLQEAMDHVVIMMGAMRAEASPTPRLAVLLDEWNFECERDLSEREQSLKTWWHRLSEDTRNGGGRFGKKMRLFPVCAHTYRLVPCGDNGQGYKIWRPRRWFTRTVAVMKVLIQVMLQVTCSTLGAVAAAALASNLLGEATGALLDVAQEEVVSTLQARLESLEVSEDGELKNVEPNPSLQHPVSLEDAPYEELRDFIQNVESTARRERVYAIQEALKRNFPPPGCPFVFFKDVMEQTPANEDHGTVQWVLKG